MRDVPPTKEWVNIEEAMIVCDVSRRTIYNWISAGKVSYKRTPGGSIRLLQAELLREDRPARPAF